MTTCHDFDGGLLIDWDLCKKVDPKKPTGGARQFTRTVSYSDSSTRHNFSRQINLQGTWQFMAADLIEDPNICQTFVHDIESAFFLLLWMALLYVKSSWENPTLSNFIKSVFHPQVVGSSGGPTKIMFMQSDRLDSLKFTTNAPLANLLCLWKTTLAIRYAKRPERVHRVQKSDVKDVIRRARHDHTQGAESAVATDDLSQEEEKYRGELQEYELLKSALQDHDVVLKILDEYLEGREWPTTEPAEKQCILLSRAEKRSLRSSSKRCREAAAESEGDALAVPPSLPKRNRSL
jgi:hypothetical protein